MEQPTYRSTDAKRAVEKGNALGVVLIQAFAKNKGLLEDLNFEEAAAAISMGFSTAALAALKWHPIWDDPTLPPEVRKGLATKCLKEFGVHFLSMAPKYKLGEPSLDFLHVEGNPAFFVTENEVKPVVPPSSGSKETH